MHCLYFICERKFYARMHVKIMCSLLASSPIWASKTSLARLTSLAQIGELARRLNYVTLEINPKSRSAGVVS